MVSRPETSGASVFSCATDSDGLKIYWKDLDGWVDEFEESEFLTECVDEQRSHWMYHATRPKWDIAEHRSDVSPSEDGWIVPAALARMIRGIRAVSPYTAARAYPKTGPLWDISPGGCA
jgi:hypothetical protein